MLNKLFQSIETRSITHVDIEKDKTVNAKEARELILTEAKAICTGQEHVRLDVLRNYSARTIMD